MDTMVHNHGRDERLPAEAEPLYVNADVDEPGGGAYM